VDFCGFGGAGVILELLNQKARFFTILIVFSRWFLEHARKVFGEISERT
jgi:hypothetical protein